MSDINQKLYDFLMNNETGLTIENDRNKSIVIAYVFIEFEDLPGFVDVIGVNSLDEGIECLLKNGYVCIKLNDFFESNDNVITDYKECFPVEDWDYCSSHVANIDNE